MRIFEGFVAAIAVAGVLGFAPADGFEKVNAPAAAPTPVEAFRVGTQALRAGETGKGVASLEYAAELGHAVAQWKLGRMYAEGEGVAQDPSRAFQYFSRMASAHADENPNSSQARFVANAFVALGHYFLIGIPHTLAPDPERARQIFSHAATYFADPDAQYQLGRMYLDGVGGLAKDARLAARWLGLAANKGQVQAQATLGELLFEGASVTRDAARGLMWLTLARDGSGDEKWVADLYDAAVKRASDKDRAQAFLYLERWLNNRRE